MNAKEFFNKVVAMREAQKTYFKVRTQTALNLSKNLEYEIDKEIERVQQVMKNLPTQTTLF